MAPDSEVEQQRLLGNTDDVESQVAAQETAAMAASDDGAADHLSVHDFVAVPGDDVWRDS